MGSGKNRWRISFHFRQQRQKAPPLEFLCPISNAPMADPVIVPSGQTFERRCIEALLALPPNHHQQQLFPSTATTTTSTPTLIPNIALKTAIANWCRDSGLPLPDPPDPETAAALAHKFVETSPTTEDASRVADPSADLCSTSEMECRMDCSDSGSKSYRSIDGASLTASESDLQLVPIDSPDSISRSNLTPDDSILGLSGSEQILSRVQSDPAVEFSYAATEVNRRFDRFDSSDSGFTSSARPLELATRPACLSESFGSVSISCGTSGESDELIAKMRSGIVSDQEEAAVELRNLTREDRDARLRMCTRELLACLAALMASRYAGLQVNAVAAFVNLSLEKVNKVKIVRSGTVPPLIDVLKGGHVEAQGHAVGAIFSLALEDENRTALGVLGAVQPLLHLLSSTLDGRARLDAAMALYHLSFARGNRAKLMRAGALPKLMALARGDEPSLATRAVLILCNLAAGTEGRAAMLDANAVAALVALIAESWQGTEDERHLAAIREHSVAALCLLARDTWRFKGLAREAGALEVLTVVAERGSDRARERAGKLLLLMKGAAASSASRDADAAEDDGFDLTEQAAQARARHKRLILGPNSTEF
ncbi:U-box domain-containing protein 38-like [Nymphaea colorata]|nr:U-box domain-containing protein 38-like [Nymphaea colorata]